MFAINAIYLLIYKIICSESLLILVRLLIFSSQYNVGEREITVTISRGRSSQGHSLLRECPTDKQPNSGRYLHIRREEIPFSDKLM